MLFSENESKHLMDEYLEEHASPMEEYALIAVVSTSARMVTGRTGLKNSSAMNAANHLH